MNNKGSKGYLHSLNALRGIGAISVCLYHSGAAFGSFGAFPHGYLAVDLFFILSGFIAFYRLDLASSIYVGANLVKRLSRIYPVYFTATILGASLMIFKYIIRGYPLVFEGFPTQYVVSFFKAMGLNILMLPDFDTHNLIIEAPIYPFSLQNWTLFWELIISTVFWIWVKFGAKFGRVIAICLAIALVLAMSKHDSMNQGYDASSFLLGGLRAFFCLFIGIECAKLYKTLSYRALNQISFFAPFLLFSCLFYFAWRGNASVLFELAIAIIIMPIMIIAVASSNSIIFANPLMHFLGKISFALFGLHVVILTLMFFLYTHFGLFELNLLSGLIYLSIVLVIATLFENYAEKPMQAFILQAFKRLLK